MRVKQFLFTITAQILLLVPALVNAQTHSESVYSDQAYDPVDQPEWYETPYFWVGLVVVLIIVLLLLRQRSRRSRTFMGPRQEK